MRTRIVAVDPAGSNTEKHWAWRRWEDGEHQHPAKASRYHLGRVVALEPTDEGDDAA